jgi:putative transposase
MQKKKSELWWGSIQMQREIELCELFAQKTGNWVSQAAMCRCLQKLGLTRKKKLGTVGKLRQKEFKN